MAAARLLTCLFAQEYKTAHLLWSDIIRSLLVRYTRACGFRIRMSIKVSFDLPLLNFFAPHKVLDFSCWISIFDVLFHSSQLTVLFYSSYMSVMPCREVLVQFPPFLLSFELLLANIISLAHRCSPKMSLRQSCVKSSMGQVLIEKQLVSNNNAYPSGLHDR